MEKVGLTMTVQFCITEASVEIGREGQKPPKLVLFHDFGF